MKHYIKEAAALLLALFAAFFISALVSIGAKAQLPKNTDYHNNLVSEEISRETQCELKSGIYDLRLKECMPVNLTDEQERYLQNEVAKLQLKRGAK